MQADEGHLGRLAGGDEALVTSLRSAGVDAGGGERGHVERGAHAGRARPSMLRRPRQAPLSRLKGATPTSDADLLAGADARVRARSASKVAAATGPIPGMLRSQAARARSVGSACTRAASWRSTCWIRAAVSAAATERVEAGQVQVGLQVVAPPLLLGHARCVTSWRRRRLEGLGGPGPRRLRGLGAQWGAARSAAKRASTPASMRSVLARTAVGAGEVADLARIDHGRLAGRPSA